jgi:hypothetical protein
MTATIKIGKAGRLVVTKAVRERLRLLRAGTVMKLECDEGSEVASPETASDDNPSPRLKMSADGLPVIVGWKKFDAVKAVKAAREEAENRLLARLGR